MAYRDARRELLVFQRLFVRSLTCFSGSNEHHFRSAAGQYTAGLIKFMMKPGQSRVVWAVRGVWPLHARAGLNVARFLRKDKNRAENEMSRSEFYFTINIRASK